MMLIGIDAGATMTRAVAARKDGSIVGTGTAGPANPHHVGAPAAAAEITRAVRTAGLGRPPDIIVAGAAGTEESDLRRDLAAALQASGLHGEIHLYSDAAIALDGAFLGDAGVIVIAGTGSVAWGRNARGDEARAGGWGHIINDAGSGYDVARRGVAAVMRAHDGRGPSTILMDRMRRALHVAHPERIAAQVRVMAAHELAALAPVVLNAARDGDVPAGEIVATAADELARAAAAVWQAVRLTPGDPVAGGGGLFEHDALREAFRRALAVACPQAVFAAPRLPPVGGAVWRAFMLRGIRLPGHLLARLVAADAGGGEEP